MTNCLPSSFTCCRVRNGPFSMPHPLSGGSTARCRAREHGEDSTTAKKESSVTAPTFVTPVPRSGKPATEVAGTAYWRGLESVAVSGEAPRDRFFPGAGSFGPCPAPAVGWSGPRSRVPAVVRFAGGPVSCAIILTQRRARFPRRQSQLNQATIITRIP